MDNEFNYNELIAFANILRFQVRAVVPSEIKMNDTEIRNYVYRESIFIGKQLLKDSFKDCEFCEILIQVCAEWTFHIACDLFTNKIPQNYHKLFIRKIMIKIYRYIINKNKNETDIFHDFSNSETKEDIEELVKKQYVLQLKALCRKKKINKEIYNNAIRNRNIEKMRNDENNFNTNISLWEFLNPNFFILLVCLIIVILLTIYNAEDYNYKKYIACIVAIIILYRIIWRIFQIFVALKNTHPKE